MSEKLKPCPFCGGKPYLFKDNFGKYGVACEKCNLWFGIKIENGTLLRFGWTAKIKTRKEAVEAWNRRANNG